MSEAYSIKCDLGVYDIPSVQMQPDFEVDLLKSNIAVFGASMSGKTNFLKLLINILHQKCDETSEQIFILDFSGAMQAYKDMPLVSAYFDNSNEEYVKRVFKILEQLLKRNTKELGSENFTIAHKKDLPHTTFIIDNLNAFVDEERYSAYHDKFGRLCRDGRSRGITIVFTATDTKGISRYLLSFEQKIALNLSADKCSELFNMKVDSIGNIAGRGYTNVTERIPGVTGTFNMNAPYEVQCRLCSDISDKESIFVKKLWQKFGYDDFKREYAKKVIKYQIFPQELRRQDYFRLRQPLSADDRRMSELTINVGLDYVEFKPVGVDLKQSRSVAIYGKKEFGKTNLLSILLRDLTSLKQDMRYIFFDDGRKELKKFADRYISMFGPEKCRYIHEFATIDIELNGGKKVRRKLSPIQQFYKLLHEEYLNLFKDYDNTVLEQIYGVDDENVMVEDMPAGADKSEAPPTVFVIQSKSIYLNTKISMDLLHYILPELMDIAEDRDLIFLFTDVKKVTDPEVNSVFNSTLKTVFLLDNIAEFASERGGKTVFGDMDNKSLKEDYAKCELGDGYYYDVEADTLKKVKFILMTE